MCSCNQKQTNQQTNKTSERDTLKDTNESCWHYSLIIYLLQPGTWPVIEQPDGWIATRENLSSVMHAWGGAYLQRTAWGTGGAESIALYLYKVFITGSIRLCSSDRKHTVWRKRRRRRRRIKGWHPVNTSAASVFTLTWGGGGRGRSWLRHPRIESGLLLEGQVQ